MIETGLWESTISGLSRIIFDISMIFSGEGRLHLRLNEREGRSCKVRLKLDGKTRTGQVGPYSIVTL